MNEASSPFWRSHSNHSSTFGSGTPALEEDLAQQVVLVGQGGVEHAGVVGVDGHPHAAVEVALGVEAHLEDVVLSEALHRPDQPVRGRVDLDDELVPVDLPFHLRLHLAAEPDPQLPVGLHVDVQKPFAVGADRSVEPVERQQV